jgi:hypothetical protein
MSPRPGKGGGSGGGGGSGSGAAGPRVFGTELTKLLADTGDEGEKALLTAEEEEI